MANRLAIPARFRIGRMRYVEIDVTHLRIGRAHDQDFFGGLKEPVGIVIPAQSQEAGNARGHAALARREGDFAGEHLVVVFLHDLLHPRLEVRVSEIADPKGWLPALAIGDKRILWIAGDGRQAARNSPTPIHPTVRSLEKMGGAAFSCAAAFPAPTRPATMPAASAPLLKVNKDIAVPPLVVPVSSCTPG